MKKKGDGEPEKSIDDWVRASVSHNVCKVCTHPEARAWFEQVAASMKRLGIPTIAITKLVRGVRDATGFSIGETSLRKHVREHVEDWPKSA